MLTGQAESPKSGVFWSVVDPKCSRKIYLKTHAWVLRREEQQHEKATRQNRRVTLPGDKALNDSNCCLIEEVTLKWQSGTPDKLEQIIRTFLLIVAECKFIVSGTCFSVL